MHETFLEYVQNILECTFLHYFCLNLQIANCDMSAPYTTYTQEQLLLLLAQSDEAAFAEIYNRYWERLYVIAYNRLAEKETAEDAVHDVFTGLWQNRGKAEIQELENYLAVAVKFNVLAKIKKLCNQRNALKSNQGGYYVEANVDELIDNKISLYFKNKK